MILTWSIDSISIYTLNINYLLLHRFIWIFSPCHNLSFFEKIHVQIRIKWNKDVTNALTVIFSLYLRLKMGRNNKNQCFLVAFYFSVFLFYNTSLGHHNIFSRKWRLCEAMAGWKQKNCANNERGDNCPSMLELRDWIYWEILY